jgi:hypothetical protein
LIAELALFNLTRGRFLSIGFMKMRLNFNISRALAGADSLDELGTALRSARQTRAWFDEGRPTPPPHPVKVRNLLTLADLFGLEVLVETGTQKGATIAATRHRFKRIYSIEIFEPFVIAARRRFARDPNVTIIQGDSAASLPALLTSIDEPILFWLDGHFSGENGGRGEEDSPIRAEIEHIINLRARGRDAIVIDDARCFQGDGGYPALDKFLAELRKAFGVEPYIATDAIFILPR